MIQRKIQIKKVGFFIWCHRASYNRTVYLIKCNGSICLVVINDQNQFIVTYTACTKLSMSLCLWPFFVTSILRNLCSQNISPSLVRGGCFISSLMSFNSFFGVFIVCHTEHNSRNVFHHIILHQHLLCVLNSHIFYPFFSDRLFAAGVPVLSVVAFIVSVHRTISARTAFTCQIDAAFATEPFCCQQIVVIGLMPCGSFLFFCSCSCTLLNRFFGTIGGIPSS